MAAEDDVIQTQGCQLSVTTVHTSVRQAYKHIAIHCTKLCRHLLRCLQKVDVSEPRAQLLRGYCPCFFTEQRSHANFDANSCLKCGIRKEQRIATANVNYISTQHLDMRCILCGDELEERPARDITKIGPRAVHVVISNRRSIVLQPVQHCHLGFSVEVVEEVRPGKQIPGIEGHGGRHLAAHVCEHSRAAGHSSNCFWVGRLLEWLHLAVRVVRAQKLDSNNV
mmetsp:Transcript_24047/g.49993  ORF Transcript_24047/g.49993 Transcript_24047/m.49993 type:complete len:224 (-) Transcript_24047:62-733(-)